MIKTSRNVEDFRGATLDAERLLDGAREMSVVERNRFCLLGFVPYTIDSDRGTAPMEATRPMQKAESPRAGGLSVHNGFPRYREQQFGSFNLYCAIQILPSRTNPSLKR
jgi:hypothetical protein